MRNLIVIFITLSAFAACFQIKDENVEPTICIIGDNAGVDSMSLYWHHEVFSEHGRILEFEFYENQGYENKYELIFDYKITNQDIVITLKDKIDKGKCPKYPMPKPGSDDGLCKPKGGFYIPENELSEGVYSVTLRTLTFELYFRLKVDKDKYTLDIPNNDKFSSRIKEVYPIPKNILYGGVVFAGKNNMPKAEAFINDLSKNGFTPATVPKRNYRHLSVDDNGKPINSHWSPDNHNFKFLFKLDKGFDKAVELAKKHFNGSHLNIYMYSSNGDQARFSQVEGILVKYAKE